MGKNSESDRVNKNSILKSDTINKVKFFMFFTKKYNFIKKIKSFFLGKNHFANFTKNTKVNISQKSFFYFCAKISNFLKKIWSKKFFYTRVVVVTLFTLDLTNKVNMCHK
jgi:hypothetical protein